MNCPRYDLPVTAESAAAAGDATASRPQLLLLMLFGDHVLDRGVCLFSGSVIEALGRVGVSEHAARSTLTRMVNRGLLRRQREGRRMYFCLTPRSVDLLHDGRIRIWEAGAVNDRWDGTWTLLGFCARRSRGPASGPCRAASGSRRGAWRPSRSSRVSGWPGTSGCSTPARTT